MKKKLYLLVAVIAALTLVVAGCGNGSSKDSAADKKLKVVTTFYPMYEFSKQVVGNKGDVSVLIGAGVEPHDYEPSAKDVAKITEADVFVYNSQYFETWVPKVLENIDTSRTTVIDASKGIKLKDFTAAEESAHEHDHEHGEDEHDHDHDNEAATDADKNPHVWLDPVLAQKQVENIQAGLVKKDKANKTTYDENAKTYVKKLDELDARYQASFENAKEKTFVTSHAAFGYLANRYHLNQLPIAGLSPEAEPSPKEMAKIKEFITKNDIKVIYFEALASPKLAETLATETGAKTVELSPLEGLTEAQQKQGLDYIKTMDNNLKALQESIK
ncbi:metal ABC transporter substrate-binding protein [Brochothrix thermosphacta]|uniref:metal ABC transporter substrate-binding protein n=1 Tax=Brochothrix thermosphacta TaxID=2756 RepID=UPI000D7977E6|nr:metal ABC transporter substrate-binding protein [Brochothrix thermosphacta]SPN74382.1 Zn(II)-binding lipoprotein [Brochothrix thermosphacta]